MCLPITTASRLRTAAFYGVPLVAIDRALSIAIPARKQRQRRRLVEPTGIRLPENTRLAADGAGDGVAAQAQQYDNS